MTTLLTQFADRRDAGVQLAHRLMHLKELSPIVLALPRGGVVVGYEVARALDAPLDIIAVRKIGVPLHPEFGIGALVDGEQPEILLDQETASALGITRDDLREQIDAELGELRRRERLYRGGKPKLDIGGRTAVVVDDGIATGSSVRAALRALRRAKPGRLVLATPVAPSRTLESLKPECDEVICLRSPRSFRAVGQFYCDFEQTSDQEVISLLEQSREQHAVARSVQGDGR